MYIYTYIYAYGVTSYGRHDEQLPYLDGHVRDQVQNLSQRDELMKSDRKLKAS